MRNIYFAVLLALLILSFSQFPLPSIAAADSTRKSEEPLAQWESFEQPDPLRAQRYNALHPPRPFSFRVVKDLSSRPLGSSKIVLVIVNTTLRPSIQDELDQYQQDLAAKGYDFALIEAEGGTQEDLKNIILDKYATWGDSLNGCLLVGELPIPWFQHFNDWDNQEDVFACDLFYGDMDGTWDDTDGDGVPDTHTDGSGDTKPEIWIGRVTAHDMSEDEVTLVKRFFHNNHQYRLDNSVLERRALLYQDDDWASLSGWYNAFGALVSDRDWISDHDTTNATDYESRFDDGYQWMLVCSHSNWTLHSFKSSSGTTYYHWYQLMHQNVHFNFCITFACSNADYSRSDYMSGWYLFARDYTQLVLGSTKTGGFWYGYDMFDALAAGENLGDAYNTWFSGKYPYSDSDISWWYGLTLLGDPTLYVPSNTYIELASFTAMQAGSRIVLKWQTGTEIDNAGFELFRGTSPDGSDAVMITPNMIASKGSLASGASYTFTDNEVEPGITYYYWLVDIDISSAWTAHGPASARLSIRPVSPSSLHAPMTSVQNSLARR